MRLRPLRTFPVLLVASLLGCGNYTTYVENYSPGIHFVGDTARFVAIEQFESMNDHEVYPSSASSAWRYSWSSNRTDVAELVEPGVFVMRAPGQTEFTVRGQHSRFTGRLTVIPAGATIHMEPRALQGKIGDTLSVTIDVRDPTGQPIPSIALRPIEVGIELRGNVDDRTLPLDPVLIPVLNQFRWVVRKAGQVTIVASGRMRSRGALRDSIVATMSK